MASGLKDHILFIFISSILSKCLGTQAMLINVWNKAQLINHTRKKEMNLWVSFKYSQL